jgi:hypothetical protein
MVDQVQQTSDPWTVQDSDATRAMCLSHVHGTQARWKADRVRFKNTHDVGYGR